MTKLFDYQERGVEFLVQGRRVGLCDDMGLGKTLQALTACMRLDLKHVLIVCPATVLGQWANQLEEHFNCLDYVIVEGFTPVREEQLKSKRRFTLINYELISSVTRMVGNNLVVNERHLPTLMKEKWDGIVLDECHRFKNRKSKTFEAVKKICRQAKTACVFPMSGTPIYNRPDELWPLLHVIDPKTYSSFWRWAEEHCILENTFFSPYPKVVDVKDPEGIQEMLHPLILRRLKRDVVNLPEKLFVPVMVELEGKQKLQYDQMEKQMFVDLEAGGIIEAVTAVAQLTRLKQIAVSADLLEPVEKTIDGAKMLALKEILEGVGDQKVVIFSQFAQAIKRLHPRVEAWMAGYETVKFTGEDPNEKRREVIKQFQEDPKTKVIMATTQAGGVGIDLYAGSVVIFLDLLWSPASNGQAVDRLHRHGQKNPVTVYFLMAKNTVEEGILQLVNSKEQLFNSLLPIDGGMPPMPEFFKKYARRKLRGQQ